MSQSGSSSLFTQPMALEAIPLNEDGSVAVPAKEATKDMLEARLDEAIRALVPTQASTADVNDPLSLFARWYYRPATRRVGEIIFNDADGFLPRRNVIRAISRVAAATQFGTPGESLEMARLRGVAEHRWPISAGEADEVGHRWKAVRT